MHRSVNRPLSRLAGSVLRFADAGSAVRASDGDRRDVQQLLNVAYAEGRLTTDELERRAELAGTASTVGQLRAALRDLPVSWTPQQISVPRTDVTPPVAADVPGGLWSLTSVKVATVAWAVMLLCVGLGALLRALNAPDLPVMACGVALLVSTPVAMIAWLPAAMDASSLSARRRQHALAPARRSAR